MSLRLAPRVPARTGALWVRDGWLAFAQRPLAYCGLFACFVVAAGVLVVVPLLGEVLMYATMPLLTLSFMLATRETLAGRKPGPGTLLEPLRADPRRRASLLLLGAIYAVATVLALMLASLIGDGSFDALREAVTAPNPEAEKIDAALADPALSARLLVMFGLVSLLSVPFWHAPALVYWGGQGVPQALFSSTIAVLRCLGAFSVYMAVWGILASGSMFICGILAALLGVQALLPLLAMPAMLVLSTAFYASLYFTFRSSFTETDD